MNGWTFSLHGTLAHVKKELAWGRSPTSLGAGPLFDDEIQAFRKAIVMLSALLDMYQPLPRSVTIVSVGVTGYGPSITQLNYSTTDYATG